MNNNYIEQKKNTHLYFQIGKNQYAINTVNVLEIMKLPALDYPQKLPNNRLMWAYITMVALFKDNWSEIEEDYYCQMDKKRVKYTMLAL